MNIDKTHVEAIEELATMVGVDTHVLIEAAISMYIKLMVFVPSEQRRVMVRTILNADKKSKNETP